MLGIGDSSPISLNLGDNSALNRFNQPTNQQPLWTRVNQQILFGIVECAIDTESVFKGESNEKTEVVLKTWKLCK